MTGFEAMFSPLLAIVTSPYLMGLILLAIPLGMFFGAVPGLGGKLGATPIKVLFSLDHIINTGLTG